MPRKKQHVNPFERKSRCRSPDGPDEGRDEEALEAALSDICFSFSPTCPRMEAAITIQFKSNCKITRGDTFLIRVPGFKGGSSGVFALEAREHPEGKDFRDSFHAYWRADTEPKGAPPPGSITLLCRRTIEADTLVVVGVPESVRIMTPDKLPMASAKIKIECTLRHNTANNGKIAKTPMSLLSEVAKKRALDEMIGEVQGVLQRHFDGAQLEMPEEQQVALEVSQAELDHIWEAARDISQLQLGIIFEMLDSSVFKSYQAISPLVKTVADTYLAASKKRVALALEKELATNLGVKVGCIVALEDILFTAHASRYPELTRGAILALRLCTCESNDLARVFCASGINTPPCIYREVNSALRCGDAELVQKWTHTIAALSTCSSKLTHISSDLMPVLYRGVKELPHDSITHLLSLKKDAFYVFPQFTTWTSMPSAIKPASSEAEAVLPSNIPDTAVLFEVHNPVDGVELCDVSQYPMDGRWMLPMFSAFSIVSVEQLPTAERNGMLHVVMRMTGSLGGLLRDNRFPEEHTSIAGITIKKAKTDSMLQAEKAQWVAKAIYANCKLISLKRQHTQLALNVQFLDRYAEVHRASLARAAIEAGHGHENIVKWQSQQVSPDPTAGAASSTGGMSATAMAASAAAHSTLVPASWDAVLRKHAVVLEQALLKKTLEQKAFSMDGIEINFANWTADFGKGLRNIRRLIGKSQTHPFMAY